MLARLKEYREELAKGNRDAELESLRRKSQAQHELMLESRAIYMKEQKEREAANKRAKAKTKKLKEPKESEKEIIIDEIQKLIDEIETFEIPKAKKVKLTKAMKKLLN
jgi:hypothetical protein